MERIIGYWKFASGRRVEVLWVDGIGMFRTWYPDAEEPKEYFDTGLSACSLPGRYEPEVVYGWGRWLTSEGCR